MAYLDLSDPQRWTLATGAAAAPSVGPALGTLDEAALGVAAHDRLASLARGRWARALGEILGLRLATPLADPRLETLRRLGVAARLGGRRLLDREIAHARSAGLTAFQIDAVLGRFGRAATEFQGN